jgi:hypothetical protein
MYSGAGSEPAPKEFGLSLCRAADTGAHAGNAGHSLVDVDLYHRIVKPSITNRLPKCSVS